MNKKKKIILGSLFTTLTISAIPTIAIACGQEVTEINSSNNQKQEGIKTRSNSNLSEIGFPINVSDLKINIKKVPINGLDNQNAQNTLEALSKYIKILKINDNTSIPKSTILSSINFQNGTDKNKAIISFSLGVLGSFVLTALENGIVKESTKFSSIYNQPKLTNISDLSQYLEGLDELKLKDANIILNFANNIDSYNPNGIQQYIYLTKGKENLGAIIGSYSTSASRWSWLYSQNTVNQISANSKTTLDQKGIPISVNNFETLSNYLDFLPILNQYSIPKNATIVVTVAKDNKQNVTITWLDSSITIEGSFSSSWAYNFKYNNDLLKSKIKDYIDKFNKLDLTTQNLETILPSSLNEQNISNYITNIPIIPDRTKIVYKIVPDNKNGNLNLTISLNSADGKLSETSQTKTVTGFNSDQKLVDQYINKFNNLSLTTNNDLATILPSEVTTNNIGQYITNIPQVLQGIKISYNLVADDIKGILELTLTISSLDNLVSKNSNKKIITNFNTVEKILNKYIDELNKLKLSAKVQYKDTLPSSLPTMTGPNGISTASKNVMFYSTYIDGNIPEPPKNVQVTYYFQPVDGLGCFLLTITAILENVKIGTNVIYVNGFKKS